MYPVKEITIPKQLLELFCYPSLSPDTGKTILSSTSPITFSSFFITDKDLKLILVLTNSGFSRRKIKYKSH